MRRVAAAIGKAGGAELASLEALKLKLTKDISSDRYKQTAGVYDLTKDEREKNKQYVETSGEPRYKMLHDERMKEAKSKGKLLDKTDAADKLQIDAAEKAALAKEKTIKKTAIPPRPYYAQRAFRILESEEMSKLSQQSMEYDEIDALLKEAEKDKNIVKLGALIKKAAKDSNANEIWNSFGYNSGPEDAENFRKEKLVPLMGEQASLSLMTEVGYIEEEIGHTNNTRSYGVSNGSFYKKSPEEQAASAAWEATKRQSRNFFQNTNRLGYGYEDTSGKFHLDLTGKLIISTMQNDMMYRLNRKEFNNSTLLKLLEDIESLDDMVRRGLLRKDLVDQMKQLGREFKSKKVGSGPGDFAEMARALRF